MLRRYLFDNNSGVDRVTMIKENIKFMSSHKEITRIYNQILTSFVCNSLLYGLSLDKRPSVFDPAKFMNDPWPGDATRGKNLLSGSEIDMFDVIGHKISVPYTLFCYINSFSWIRDIQAVGGGGARKFVRKVVSYFIAHYKSRKKFWMNSDWDIDVTAERIINWMTSYSFFAIGAEDTFQKEILSSINEQYSHIVKIYKAETDPLSKIMGIKAMLFCLAAMKSNQKRQAKHLIQIITETVNENIDSDGMYRTRNPTGLFNVFRSLIEVRFIARNMQIEIFDAFFKETLSKMASAVRFFRMSDGLLSKHSGNAVSITEYMFRGTRHIIDVALSLVDNSYNIRQNKVSIGGFDRISTKKLTVIINKSASDVRSVFNPPSQPGLNIFDFEASFQANSLIKKADIAVLWNNHMVKADKHTVPNVSISKDNENLNYICEAVNFDRIFQFAVRREISVGIAQTGISVTDFIYTSSAAEVFIRIAFDKNTELEKVNSYSILIRSGKNSYMLSLKISSELPYHISVKLNDICRILIISFKNYEDMENEIIWSIVLI